VFFYGQWRNQNAMKSNPGDDRKISPGEVYQYKQLNNILTQGTVNAASYSAIASHYRQIANGTQVTCIKSYALEMEAAAVKAKGNGSSEGNNQFFQSDWDIYQKYVTGGCEALKALESLSGMHHIKPLIKP
ncbi:MAG: hypothetical protein LH702_05120, partial [Phormidesmis sp. CAN_BIN44]|nr:hypothetical protein [Phormidesmis sp. CAN_BIN44]